MQSRNCIAIGQSSGRNNQGQYSIAIGSQAGFSGQNQNSIILNASGTGLSSYNSG